MKRLASSQVDFVGCTRSVTFTSEPIRGRETPHHRLAHSIGISLFSHAQSGLAKQASDRRGHEGPLAIQSKTREMLMSTLVRLSSSLAPFFLSSRQSREDGSDSQAGCKGQTTGIQGTIGNRHRRGKSRKGRLRGLSSSSVPQPRLRTSATKRGDRCSCLATARAKSGEPWKKADELKE